MNLKHIHAETQVRATQKETWDVLSKYGDVSTFHAGVVKSHKVTGSEDKAALGSERICNIVDMGLPITLKERIVHYDEGRSYQYEVYEWKNFPIQKMFFGFSIIEGEEDHTILAIDIEYLAKPAFLTPLMARKMRGLAHDVLLGYKHFIETGEKRVPIRKLKKHYQNVDRQGEQYG